MEGLAKHGCLACLQTAEGLMTVAQLNSRIQGDAPSAPVSGGVPAPPDASGPSQQVHMPVGARCSVIWCQNPGFGPSFWCWRFESRGLEVRSRCCISTC